MQHLLHDDTICALSTAPGMGAIALIRLSGKDAFRIFQPHFSKDLSKAKGYSAYHGFVMDGDRSVDDVMLTIFRNPQSYTGEDVIEIACHGSVFIQQEILQILVKAGARLASPGEYSMRAFLNGKMDLSQAEAVNDLIEAQSSAAHELALKQMRGGFSNEIKDLREKLIHFASLVELELDFSEEDVEFADRSDLKELVDALLISIQRLLDSFATGNVIKKGVPVAITGAPNTGKSTLLNALLNEERAIVSDIAGTTRDTIEDEIDIEGVKFRFIDTAGIRETANTIEGIGIERAIEKAREAAVVLFLVDAVFSWKEDIEKSVASFKEMIGDKVFVVIANKVDKSTEGLKTLIPKFQDLGKVIYLSSKTGEGMDELKSFLRESIDTGLLQSQSVVSSVRHFDALTQAQKSLTEVRKGLDNNISGDFLATDIRKALHHLGEITGEISTDDLLGNIFGKFCIGK